MNEKEVNNEIQDKNGHEKSSESSGSEKLNEDHEPFFFKKNLIMLFHIVQTRNKIYISIILNQL